MSSALKFWELDNNVELVDPARDGLYAYDAAAAADAARKFKPASLSPHHYRRVRISAIALIKMVTHARSGGSLEIMGLMQGYVHDDSFIVTDAFRLPVEGTETRVNAHEDANEYMVAYAQMCRDQGGRSENVVGWYHSHPGYGCWLSGIDVGTQTQQQLYNEPFLAIVIDPDRTINSGKVEIGAFRTYPPNYKAEPEAATLDATRRQKKSAAANSAIDSGSGTAASAAPPAATSDGYEAVPLDKVAEFGAHSSRYYPLEVTHFKSTLDTQLLESLWHKYWVQTLSQSPLFTGRDYGTKRVGDLASKVREVSAQLGRAGSAAARASLVQTTSQGRGVEKAMEKAVREAGAVALRERGALMAGEVKAKIFIGGQDDKGESENNRTLLPQGPMEMVATETSKAESLPPMQESRTEDIEMKT